MTDIYSEELRARFASISISAASFPDNPGSAICCCAARSAATRQAGARRAGPAAARRRLLGLLEIRFSAGPAVWLKERGRRTESPPCFPTCRDRAAPVFLCFSAMRAARTIGELRGHLQSNGALEGSSTPRSMPRWPCRPASRRKLLGRLMPDQRVAQPFDVLSEVLELPDKVFPVAGLCLGYPAQSGFISMRLPLDATVHIDRYDEAGLAARSMATIGGATRATRSADRSARRNGSAPPNSTAGRGQGAPGGDPEGTGFATWLRARGFTFDEPRPPSV